MKPILAFVLIAFAGMTTVTPAASGSPATGPDAYRIALPALINDNPHAASRTYGMGFGITPPKPAVQAVLDLVPQLAKVSDYAIVQREVPWTRILAGTPMDQVIDEDYVALVDYLRGNGLKLVVLVDPLDGLNRRAEATETTKNGRSLLESGLRALHEQWVERLTARLKPEYIGLASEINTLGAHGDRALYDQIRDMCNALAPRLRALSPGSKVFVSFQVDDAWGVPPWPQSDVDQFAMTREFDLDVVGLSSYPGFSFAAPADIPDDYFRRFQRASGKPLLLAEGGWSSAPGGFGAGSGGSAQQADYFSRLFTLLDGVQAELVVMLLFSDLDLSDPAWGLPPDRAATLQNFAHMGIVDTTLSPKPAYSVWAERFKRPRNP
jgi:hypothetical protein